MEKRLTPTSILKFLSHVSGSDVNISFEILKRIQETSSNRAKVLKDLFELSEIATSDKTEVVEEYIDKEQAALLFSKYSSYVLSYLKILIDSKLPVESFYKQLWLFIDENPFLQTTESKAMALSLIWNEFRLPYFVFEPSGKMDKTEFSEIYQRIAIKISKARFVIYSDYDLKTERAADLLSILDEIEDKKEKQVLLALALSYNEKKAKSMADKK